MQSRPLYLYVDFALAISLSTFASRCSCFGLSGPRQLSIHKASGTCARFCGLKSFLVHLGTHGTACSLFSSKSWGRLRNSCNESTTCSLDGQSLESMPEFLESWLGDQFGIFLAENRTHFSVRAWRCEGVLLEDSACVTWGLRWRCLPFLMSSNRLKSSGQSTMFSMTARKYSSGTATQE